MITSLNHQVGNIPPGLVPQYFDDKRVFSPDTFFLLLKKACADVNSQLSEKVLLSLDSKDYDTLLELEISPHSYNDATLYYKDAQLIALIKKYPKWQSSHEPETQAKKTFLACEASCRDTNHRIWNREEFKTSWAVNSVIAIAQRKISNILGECPSHESLSFKFGPGASYSVKYNTDALAKLSSTIDVTKDCHDFFKDFLESVPGWRPNNDFDLVGPIQQRVVTHVKGDRLSFVPKTAKTHRPIGIGPLLNGVIQKAYGCEIRRRLRPYLDLNTCQDKHRELARKSSLDGELATIDLKSASDTIAYAVVQDLLPDSWFQALHASRSSQYTIEGNWFPYQKFSAMGNGYTFELETLLFYCLSVSVTEYLKINTKDVSVYGDDIIIPTACVSLLKETLHYLGFSINEEKSFFEGPFRESCGGDYYNGIDVRPFYLKDELSFRTLFLMRNYFERTGFRFLFKRTFRFLSKLLGKETINHYRTGNSLDDFALFDATLPLCSYNSIVAFEKGKKINHEVRRWGVSYGLYRLMIRYEPTEVRDSPMYKTRRYRVKYKPYRRVHI